MKMVILIDYKSKSHKYPFIVEVANNIKFPIKLKTIGWKKKTSGTTIVEKI